MRKLTVLSSAACATLFLTTGAVAEILGVQPGTSSNPKDNVPKEIQRATPGGGSFGPGGSGPGTRSDDLVGMKKEKPEPVTLEDMEKNVERTQGGGSALAAEELKEKSMYGGNKDRTGKQGAAVSGGSPGGNGPKKDPRVFRELNSDRNVQGQQLVNEQPLDTQQPANRPASERGATQP
jgi:hypothetical protein